MPAASRKRLRLVLGAVVLAAVVLVMALFNLQINNGKSYAAKAEKQYVKPSVSSFDRGTIYFTQKDGSLVAAATVSTGYLIYMNPSVIMAPEQMYQVLSQYLKLDHEDFLRRAAKPNDRYEELAHRVPEDVAQSIRGLGATGIGIAKETWRSYPGGDLASQTLGLIGEKSASTDIIIEGRYGLERTYQSVLARSGSNSSVNMFAQLFSSSNSSGANSSSTDEKNQGDIISTIEPNVQGFVQKELEKTQGEWHPDEIGGIIMDPSNGAIISAATLPSYDPNNTGAAKDTKVFSNSLVEHVYEMGSIMKPLTMSVGLDTGVITPESTYNDTGTMTLNTKKISNYDGKARGVIDMQQILSQSLNIGAATVALKAGAGAMYTYFTNFGFGEKTGIDLPNEATGLPGNLKSGRDIDTATISYGQGIAISPMEMIRALAVLANGGYKVTPHVISKIEYTNGTSKDVDAPKTGPVLQKKTVDEVTRMLVTVVDTALRQGKLKRDNYSVAAKTGTAQIPDHVNGGYYGDRYLHSFFGYFPAYNPRFIIFLYQIYPRGAQYASETLANPFDEITSYLINYYNIEPDR